MVTKSDVPDDETQRLRARVAELEAALANEQATRVREQAARVSAEAAGAREDTTTKDMRNTMNKAMDEYARFFRGLTMAYFDGLRLAAETAANFAKDMTETSKRTDTAQADTSVNTVMDQSRNIATGCTSAFTDALNRAVDIPRQTVDMFYDNYREPARPNQ